MSPCRLALSRVLAKRSLRAVAGIGEAVAEGAGEVVVGIIAVAAKGELQRHRLTRLIAHAAADYLLQDLRAVRQAERRVAVIFVSALRAQAMQVEAQRVAGGKIRVQRQVFVAIAVAIGVRVVHAAACIQRCADAAAGIDAIGRLVAGIDTESAARAAQVKADRGFAQVMAADADTRMWAQAVGRVAATGEHLDHTTDRIRAIQGRTRAADDLDPLDLLQRQVLQRGQARAGRTDAHAIDQDEGVVGLGATQKQRAELAQPALVDDADASATAQQFRQRMRAAAFDLGAVDDLDGGHAGIGGDCGAGGSDDDVVEVGGLAARAVVGLCMRKAGQGECKCECGTAKGVVRLHDVLRRARPRAHEWEGSCGTHGETDGGMRRAHANVAQCPPHRNQ